MCPNFYEDPVYPLSEGESSQRGKSPFKKVRGSQENHPGQDTILIPEYGRVNPFKERA